MTFGTIRFPCEPVKLRLRQERKYRFFVSPFGEQIPPQLLELTPREAQAELWFNSREDGDSCLSLCSAFAAQPEGTLTLPDGVSFEAYFTGIEKEESAQDHILRLTLRFTEKL